MSSNFFHIDSQATVCLIHLSGNWQLGSVPDGESLCADIPSQTKEIRLACEQLGTWDSSLAMALLQLARWCYNKQITLDISAAPTNLQKLLNLATAVPAFQPTDEDSNPAFAAKARAWVETIGDEVRDTLIFLGNSALAFRQWLRGKAKTRSVDIQFFIGEAGPKALPIVTLISLLVGMILAYLGSVQLRQLGAQVYVANLVSLGMVREMGALMTAIIIAGRTGAAYAAQLGTMQVNEEIDALKTMGISSMEFLVLPRLLALVFVMPLLCIYSDIIGMAGGALIASGMDVSFKQYILQAQSAVDWMDIFSGIYKSIAFGILIAIAGCQAGLNCGRSSTAVGVATTHAVVRAIVYLVVADAAFNIIYDKLGI